MRIAIADDRQEDRDELSALLKRYLDEEGLQADYEFFASAGELLAQFSPLRFDIIFLDIYMGEITGMEAARRIRAADGACRLVFFTTSSAHAVESYTVQASYYLTKPLDYARVRQAMDAVCAAFRSESRCLAITSGHVQAQIPMRQIMYADCEAERLVLHLEDRMIPVDGRAGDALDMLLADERFLCCNRNVAVSMDWIASVGSDDFLLKNGQSVPIRQHGRAAVKKDYLTYSLKALRKDGQR